MVCIEKRLWDVKEGHSFHFLHECHGRHTPTNRWRVVKQIPHSPLVKVSLNRKRLKEALPANAHVHVRERAKK